MKEEKGKERGARKRFANQLKWWRDNMRWNNRYPTQALESELNSQVLGLDSTRLNNICLVEVGENCAMSTLIMKRQG